MARRRSGTSHYIDLRGHGSDQLREGTKLATPRSRFGFRDREGKARPRISNWSELMTSPPARVPNRSIGQEADTALDELDRAVGHREIAATGVEAAEAITVPDSCRHTGATLESRKFAAEKGGICGWKMHLLSRALVVSGRGIQPGDAGRHARDPRIVRPLRSSGPRGASPPSRRVIEIEVRTARLIDESRISPKKKVLLSAIGNVRDLLGPVRTKHAVARPHDCMSSAYCPVGIGYCACGTPVPDQLFLSSLRSSI